MPRQHQHERVLVERIEQHVTARRDRRGAWRIAEQCDLSETLAATESRDVASGTADGKSSVRDDVVEVTGVTLAYDDSTAWCAHRNKLMGDAFERRTGEGREDRCRVQQLDLHVWYRRRAVDGDEPS